MVAVDKERVEIELLVSPLHQVGLVLLAGSRHLPTDECR